MTALLFNGTEGWVYSKVEYPKRGLLIHRLSFGASSCTVRRMGAILLVKEGGLKLISPRVVSCSLISTKKSTFNPSYCVANQETIQRSRKNFFKVNQKWIKLELKGTKSKNIFTFWIGEYRLVCWIFQKVPKNSKCFQNIPYFSKIFQIFPKYSKFIQSIPNFPKYSNVSMH